MQEIPITSLEKLNQQLIGELKFDELTRALYSVDASVYRMLPTAVAFPKDENDIIALIHFAKEQQTSLIPRTAGTSLAGQCVGKGIVVDVSKHMTAILELDLEKKTVRVQPGVIRDELNRYLKEYGLFFGPNTSTSNRCMIGGMVGNNSSGTTSIQYGVTRDKVLELNAILSDGSQVTFGRISATEFNEKLNNPFLEGEIYRQLYEELSPSDVQQRIKSEYPKPEIHRRNTGYALDELLSSEIFDKSNSEEFNLCKLISGSEGTLAFYTEIELQLDEIQPSKSVMVAAHFHSIDECLNAVVPAMNHTLYTCEMMDKVILDCTKDNITQRKNRFFIEGDPAAILMFEVASDTKEDAYSQAQELIKTLESSTQSYAHPILYDGEIKQAFELRKAGLGLLGNMIGDRKAVACIEDTAVALQDLAPFISEFSELMKQYDQQAVYYAHAGAGEIHLRPILNLKKSSDVELFRKITTDVAHLTKKYQGSFSGEHGDGIVRAEFIPLMLGQENYELCRRVKSVFDPHNIFNPKKIVDAYKMDDSLRYEVNRSEPEINTLMDFSDSQGILRAAEKCNGSGDCRKLPSAGGAMCPSYHATREEQHTTRGRANALREFLTREDKINQFDSDELKRVFDLCLSCKACASECPSNVDIATLKAEFLHQYQEENGISRRTKLFAYNTKYNQLGSKFPSLTNFIFSNPVTSWGVKKVGGIAMKRPLPKLSKQSFRKQFKAIQKKQSNTIKTVYLFVDEFTNYLDAEIGVAAVELLQKLNYEVNIVEHEESGRTFLSKGILNEAQRIAVENVSIFKSLISKDTPLIGIEPSAILSFRDEYKRLVDDVESAQKIGEHTYLIDEFLQYEIKNGNISPDQFTTEKKEIWFHGHCHQKALSNQQCSLDILSLPENFSVHLIPSGCCGMAGSFGYEKEHYDVSMKVGEQVLFPSIRKTPDHALIAATGTSCRHQIKDGVERIAKHPVVILREGLKTP